jgi:hypothetical protein
MTRLAHPRTVEQAWRRPAPPRESTPEIPVTPQHSIQRIQNPTTPAIPGIVRTPGESPTPSLRKFEGVELDRLTDDVMKRIERHLRIERERRGM